MWKTLLKLYYVEVAALSYSRGKAQRMHVHTLKKKRHAQESKRRSMSAIGIVGKDHRLNSNRPFSQNGTIKPGRGSAACASSRVERGRVCRSVFPSDVIAAMAVVAIDNKRECGRRLARAETRADHATAGAQSFSVYYGFLVGAVCRFPTVVAAAPAAASAGIEGSIIVASATAAAIAA